MPRNMGRRATNSSRSDRKKQDLSSVEPHKTIVQASVFLKAPASRARKAFYPSTLDKYSDISAVSALLSFGQQVGGRAQSTPSWEEVRSGALARA